MSRVGEREPPKATIPSSEAVSGEEKGVSSFIKYIILRMVDRLRVQQLEHFVLEECQKLVVGKVGMIVEQLEVGIEEALAVGTEGLLADIEEAPVGIVVVHILAEGKQVAHSLVGKLALAEDSFVPFRHFRYAILVSLQCIWSLLEGLPTHDREY